MTDTGGTPLEIDIARVVGETLEELHDDAGVSISSSDLAARCFVEGAHWKWHKHPPAISTVSLVLEYLESAGVLAWAKAHVQRWCTKRKCDHAPFPLPRPVRHAEGHWRCPKRRIFVVGYAATLVVAAAAGATSIVTTPEEPRPVQRSSEIAFSEPVQKSTGVSTIENALEADARERAEWLLRMKLRL